MDWLSPQVYDGLTLALVHGEEAGTLAFETLVKETFPQVKTRVPYYLETLEITPEEYRFVPDAIFTGKGAETSPPYSESLEYRSMLKRLERLQESFVPRKAPFSPSSLANLEALLNMAEEIILR
jgi:hypothetical protein